jgi:protease-4
MSNQEDTGHQQEREKTPQAWERDLINRLAFAALNEQRKARRWNIFYRGMLLLFLFSVILISLPDTGKGIELGRHTAFVEIQGVIAPESEASADNIVTGLRAAFENKNTAGIIIRINSPGGSPVQAGYVNDEIKRLRELHPEIPLYAVIADICASGGYYIAAAADKIYADKASMVGSIGVLMNGFGFVDTMGKLGVERRLLTAGKHKGFMDPFSPLKEADVAHMTKLLENIHQQFIDVVKTGRGEKLANMEELFSGYVWTGEQSIALGLVDALGSSSYVARDVIKAEKMVNYTHKPTYFDRFADRVGVAMARVLSTNLGLSPTGLR